MIAGEPHIGGVSHSVCLIWLKLRNKNCDCVARQKKTEPPKEPPKETPKPPEKKTQPSEEEDLVSEGEVKPNAIESEEDRPESGASNEDRPEESNCQGLPFSSSLQLTLFPNGTYTFGNLLYVLFNVLFKLLTLFLSLF